MAAGRGQFTEGGRELFESGANAAITGDMLTTTGTSMADDIEMFKKRKDLSDPHEIKTLEEEMVLNSLNVLFKRGIKGTYLYAHDPLLRKTLVSMFKQATQKTK